MTKNFFKSEMAVPVYFVFMLIIFVTYISYIGYNKTNELNNKHDEFSSFKISHKCILLSENKDFPSVDLNKITADKENTVVALVYGVQTYTYKCGNIYIVSDYK